MKKYLLGAVLGTTSLLFINDATAQSNVRFGVKGGLNLSHATNEYAIPNGPSINNSYFGPGFYGGGLMEVSFPRGSKVKLQAEALFNYHSLLNKDNDVNYRLGAVSIPVMVKYFPVPDFGLMLGGVANINVLGKAYSESLDRVTDIDNLTSFQPGILFGANYYIKKGFFVDARYTYNFGNIVDYTNDNYKFNYGTISLGIGYKFR